MSTSREERGGRRNPGRNRWAVAPLAMLLATGCGSDGPSAEPVEVTTVAADPAEILAAGPSAASFTDTRTFDDLLDDVPAVDGAYFQGGYPNGDAGNLDLGYPPEPCTPSQRLDAGEFGAHEITTKGFRLDDDSGRGGFRLVWFDSEDEAAAYLAAYPETCAAYETVQRSGAERGIERTLAVEAITDLGGGETAVLSTEWKATLNGLSWGGDTVHATRVGPVVAESTLRFSEPPAVRVAEAEAYFVTFIDHVRPLIEP
ncbi:MAG: hypothetical protein AAF962_03485 [Actinomycetota bacterium]